jgi:hypothetical protein
MIKVRPTTMKTLILPMTSMARPIMLVPMPQTAPTTLPG